MKKLFLFISFSIFFLPLRSQAQHNLRLSAGSGAFISNIDHWKLPYWDNGYEFHVGADYRINDQIYLFLKTSYQKMLYDNGHVAIVEPMVVGYHSSIKGENSTLIDISTGTKLYMTRAFVSPYLAFGAGVLFIHQGKILVHNWIGAYKTGSDNLYDNTGQKYQLGEVNFGMGMEFAILHQLHLDFNIKIIRAFYGPIYVPVTTSLIFKL